MRLCFPEKREKISGSTEKRRGREARRMERITLAQAVKIMLAQVKKIEEKETVSLWEAEGRVLAEDITAGRDQPPFARSPLDGYAVRSADIRGADREHPQQLCVIDEVTAGHVSDKKVEKGTAVRIMTGAPIPEGADCVIKQEDTDYGEEEVLIWRELKAWENYCPAGEDYREGDRLLEEGRTLGFVEVGVLAGLGREKVTVYRRPEASVITTGDELLLPGEPAAPGKIYDSNLYTLVTRLESLGVSVTDKGRVEDEAATVAKRLAAAAKQADILITTGGVSVGKKDIMHEVIQILGCERLFWKIAIKPGMPTLCARYGEKLLLCLSGNPYGAAVNLELLVRPVLARLTGKKELLPQKKPAVTDSGYPKRSPVTRYVRSVYEDGHVRIAKGSNDSGILSNLCGCNCLMEIPAGTEEVREGEMVWVVLL